jgi:hypothetical protein
MTAKAWTRTAHIGLALRDDLPLGPFEGIELPVLRTASAKGKLHGDPDCGYLRQALPQQAVAPLTAGVVGRLCTNCRWTIPAEHPIWDLVELSFEVSLTLRHSDADDDDDQDEGLPNDVDRARLILVTRTQDDAEEVDYQARRHAHDLRELLCKEWRQATTYLMRAHRVIASAPWLADWAADLLTKAADRVDTYRSCLAYLVDPEVAAIGAAAAALTRPAIGGEAQLTAAVGDDALVDRMWHTWQREANRSWTPIEDQYWVVGNEVDETLGRRRVGREEVEQAAERLVTSWCAGARAAAAHASNVQVKVRIPPLTTRPAWQYQERDLLNQWCVAAIATYQESVDWTTGTASLTCPTYVADALAYHLDHRTLGEIDREPEPNVIGPRPEDVVLWGPAVPVGAGGFSIHESVPWPVPDAPEPPRATLAWGRWVVARHGDARLPRALASISDSTDLRTVTWPDWMTPANYSDALCVLLGDSGMFRLEPFLRGDPLGPLADLQVYSTDAESHSMGKSHGVGCKHFDRLTPEHDLHPLAAFIGILIEAEQRDRWSSRWCSKCGGFSIRRLNDEQFAYCKRVMGTPVGRF